MYMLAIMPYGLRKDWSELRRGRPGYRFRARYERAQRDTPRFRLAKRLGVIIAATVCFAIGVVLSVMPGPAFVFFILAGGLLATESKTIARLMDRSEVLVRRILSWAKSKWAKLPFAARIVIVFAAACCTAGAVFVGYRIISG
jgi:uncharacterized membrane protein YbaN (DUF454 family)